VSCIGLIVNPVAGMGGRVGLKGTDGPDLLERALERGAVPVAADRAGRALARLHDRCASVRLVAAPGRMGAELAQAYGFATDVLPGGAEETTADDTRLAAVELERRRVELIVFAGGDGTARDIHAVVGDRVPMLGVPTGVKMHSAVFATTPENAGDVVGAFVGSRPRGPLREADVVDSEIDADAISTRLYGAARVPDDRLRVQEVKSRGAPPDEEALDAVCAAIAASMDPRRIYLLGPGTTMRRVARQLGIEKTLLGVDAVRAGRLLGSDLGEHDLLELVADEPATMVIGVVGGQGALLGRGNQQLSPAVLRRVGIENIEIVAGLRKLLALEPAVLHVDTGDPELDRELCGYRRVHVAPRRTLVYRVAA
jgi:predicted polyphosphate/ATP-dependent NAD kinase